MGWWTFIQYKLHYSCPWEDLITWDNATSSDFYSQIKTLLTSQELPPSLCCWVLTIRSQKPTRRCNWNNNLPQQGPGKIPVNRVPTRLKFIVDNHYGKQQLEVSTAKAQRGAAVLCARTATHALLWCALNSQPLHGRNTSLCWEVAKNEGRKKNWCVFFLLSFQLLGLKMQNEALKLLHANLLLGRGNVFSTCWFVLLRQVCLQSSLLTSIRSSTFILQPYFSTNDTRRYKPTQAE